MKPILKRTKFTPEGICVVPTWSKDFYEAVRNDELKKKAYVSGLKEMKRFSEIYKRACNIIHAISDLYQNVSMGQIRIYFGRSQYETFYENCRYKHRQNYHGVVPVCYIPIEDDIYKEYETLAIKLAKRQQERDALCVGGIKNKLENGRVGMPAESKPILYLAWEIVPYEAMVSKPSESDKRLICSDIIKEYKINSKLPEPPNRSVVLNALKEASRLSKKINLYWDTEFTKSSAA